MFQSTPEFLAPTPSRAALPARSHLPSLPSQQLPWMPPEETAADEMTTNSTKTHTDSKTAAPNDRKTSQPPHEPHRPRKRPRRTTAPSLPFYCHFLFP